MAINLSTNTNESPIIRNTTFTETVNVTVDGTPPEVISSITVGKPQATIIITEDENAFTLENSDSDNIISEISNHSLSIDSGVTISTTTSSITFSGSYEDAFDQDEIQSLPNGESDITTTPTVSPSFDSVPTGHFVFSAIQDPRTNINVTYDVLVVYDTGTHTDTITHVINTDIEAFQTKLTELYPAD